MWMRSWEINPILLPDLTLFLVEGMAAEWDNTSRSSTPTFVDSLWPDPSKSHQIHPTYMGGVQPKVPVKPSTSWPQLRSQSRPKEGPDPVKYPHRWIAVQMSRIGTHHLHWWKEIRIRASRRTFRGIVKEGHRNYEFQHSVLWQVAAFRLPATQQEASGWWDALHWLSRPHPQVFIPITDASRPRTSRS